MSSAFLMNLVIQLVAGAVGGNVAGALLKQFNLGPLVNSICGIVGGGLGGQLLSMLVGGGGAPAGGFDIGWIVTQIVGGGIGGGVLLVIVGLVRQFMGGQHRHA
jgi:uncharacterized membrane protein YeaQ/YmgE (transglycosylase-associated protein family)